MVLTAASAASMVSDKRVVQCCLKPGHQPGRWRLQLGQCFVGALARSLSPQQASVREDDVWKGRRAEIQDLQGGRCGRARSRQRRMYRSSQQRVLKMQEDITIGTWNTQGANWARTEERHIAKFKCLTEAMRDHSIDVMCLTDLNGQMDERVGVDSRFESCMIEEFVLVQCGKVGFLMVLALSKCWYGKATCWDEAGRVALIDVLSAANRFQIC